MLYKKSFFLFNINIYLNICCIFLLFFSSVFYFFVDYFILIQYLKISIKKKFSDFIVRDLIGHVILLLCNNSWSSDYFIKVVSNRDYRFGFGVISFLYILGLLLKYQFRHTLSRKKQSTFYLPRLSLSILFIYFIEWINQ